MKTRREFLRLIGIGIGGAALAVPAFAVPMFAEPHAEPVLDPQHPRFGVWTVQYHIKGMMCWAKCDCGTEQEIHADEFFTVDALSCPHAGHHVFPANQSIDRVCHGPRRFFPVNSEPTEYVCYGTRRFFFNGDGMRIWRCGWCEEDDIRNHLRRKYGSASSAQFRANMERQQRKKFNFSIRKEDRETKERVSYAEYRRRQRDYERTQWAALTATEQAAAWQRRETYLWSHFLEMDKRWVNPIAGCPRCEGYRPLAPSWPSHFDCVCGTFVILDRWLPDDVERITMKTPEELEDLLKSQRS